MGIGLRSLKNLKLQTKFLLGLTALTLLGGLLIATAMHFHLNNLLESEVSNKAELVLDQVESVQRYVQNVLRPVMYDTLPQGEFLIEAMSSSYVSRRVMEEAVVGNYDYSYRRVAINARNPDSEAGSRQIELIEYFREHPELDRWEGFKRIEDREYFIQARPVRFEASCMHCHGVPEDAPRELIERYGAERGFGHAAGQVWGLMEVNLPVHLAVLRIRDAIYGTIFFAFIGAFFCLMMATLLFNRLVMGNLRRVINIFHRHFGEQDQTEILDQLSRGDEIEELVHGVEDLVSHLGSAKRKLEDYAVNLQQMVADRTAELSTEASERRKDVQLFVELLGGVSQSNTRRGLIERTLPKIAKRYEATRAAFVCVFSSRNFYSWPVLHERPELPSHWRDLISENSPYVEEHRAIIPVQPVEGVVDGLLLLEWEPGGRNPEELADVLMALGRQLAIALENLDALDSVQRQNDLLESVIEGISDPLLLMNKSGQIVLTNQAARVLLGGEDKERSMSELFGIGPAHGGHCPLRRVFILGKPHFSEVTLPDNRSFDLYIYPLPGPLSGAEGQEERAVVYTRENTLEKRMLAQMQQSEKMVTVGKLAAGLAHEINNPLGVILCYAELLKSEETGPDDADVIIHHTKQAQKVLQELLNFARPKHGVRARLNLSRDLGTVLEAFQVQAQARDVELSVHLPDEEVPVFAEAASMEQILSNLLINALDAVSPSTGRIELTLGRSGKDAFLRLADNGPGVPPKDVHRLFDPFFTTKEVGRGTGLGLAIVYGLVQDLGGRVEVENQGGAVFTVHIPLMTQRERSKSARREVLSDSI